MRHHPRLIFITPFLLLTVFAFAGETWQLVNGIQEPNIKEIVIDPYHENILYAGSEKRLYRSDDNGLIWTAVFSARGDSNAINFIGVSPRGVFICTDRGVFRSVDGITNWTKIFKGVGAEENSALHIAFSKGDVIYIGTRGGLFISNDNGTTWLKDKGALANEIVKWIDFLEQEVFVVAETGLYKGTDSGWKRIFVTAVENTGYDAEITDEAISSIEPVNSIYVHDKTLFLATDSGIFESKDSGNSWQRFLSSGLLSNKINRILFKEGFYAATDKGVFLFSEEEKSWRSLHKGMAANKAYSLSMGGKDIIWVGTNNGLFKSIGAAYLSSQNNEPEILTRFQNEPDIRQVQEAAIRYGEVHPDKIKEWREAAKKKAFLPNVSLGLDRYVTDFYHWDAGANPDVLLKGDDTVSWDITMSWNLGEIIWNDDQTDIDTRSRLMVQLREDILDEVTRTYFERRRLQVEIYLNPPLDLRQKIEKELRIQELTADLDALTGGEFTAMIDH